MDLIIRNLEALQDYHTKGDKHPIEKLVIDLGQLSEMEQFTEIFEKACEEYTEDNKKTTEHIRVCANCKYCELDSTQEPCRSCWRSMKNRPNWVHKEPTLEEAKIKSIDECKTCKHWALNLGDEPCHSCYVLDQDRYEPKEPEIGCDNCKHRDQDLNGEPCISCWKSHNNRPNWEPKEPTLKEATERMKSEWDATGNDVRVFMNERVIKR